ncbi:uridine diphosphate glucose pyrophosphatase NUDT22-like isoform X1 [Stegodyphus dumicola]|uniref:uridine diphosphate glucose pyrophosphatase NUDT22-like isoform X1 n=1 Tax=Stegodyphus dumicola TaxID=202533 RepID=UPI0015ACE07D|nr:uridine diphosphate glucose pyrophosphatase NUDT22-like isoform X1 [Stegodyphus dumicola]
MEINDSLETFCVAGKGLTKDLIKVHCNPKYNMKPHPIFQHSIEKLWIEKSKTGVNLFNASKFRFYGLKVEDPTICNLLPRITCFLGITNYKEFIGTNYAPHAEQLVKDGMTNYSDPQAYLANPLGVGALLETRNGDIVFMRRSNTCAEMPGRIDRPGGHPEPDEVKNASCERMECVKPAHIVDELFESVLKEIRDEINIPIKALSYPVLLGISYNPDTCRKPSLEFYCQVNCGHKKGI